MQDRLSEAKSNTESQAQPEAQSQAQSHTKACRLVVHNSLSRIDELFPGGEFSMDRWLLYMEGVVPNAREVILDDIKKYDFDRDCLPHIRNVFLRPDEVADAVGAFECVTNGLEEKLLRTFGKTLDVEIILYLGLCNGAGWATKFNGQDKVLLGIEKILELNWHDHSSMTGLVYHELGHIFQEQYGVLDRNFEVLSDELLWQLFIEGIAMVFEQMLVGDDGYYHQDINGWKDFLTENLSQLKLDFSLNLHRKDSERQHFFGDWASYHGYGDAGYFLGAEFLRFLMEKYEYEELLNFELEQVKEGYKEFMEI